MRATGELVLEMKRLRLLWEFHARGTIAAVAEALNYSPSAVSQQLALLERETGVPLLRRTGRTLELTAAGSALVAETDELLAGLERAEAALHRVRAEVTGTVRVAVFQTAMLAIMPAALRRLGDRNADRMAHRPAVTLSPSAVLVVSSRACAAGHHKIIELGGRRSRSRRSSARRR